MVWCSIIWYGMVWYGMVWYGIVWYVWQQVITYLELVVTENDELKFL